jgi:hypothetical protein
MDRRRVNRLEPGSDEYLSLYSFWRANGNPRATFQRGDQAFIAVEDNDKTVFIEVRPAFGDGGWYGDTSFNKVK